MVPSRIAERILHDLNPGIGGSQPDSFLAIGDHIYFSAAAPGVGTELWSLPFECIRDCRPKRRVVR